MLMDMLLGAAAGVQNVQNCKSETVTRFHFALHTGCCTFFYCQLFAFQGAGLQKIYVKL
jgi:hypothetical protein